MATINRLSSFLDENYRHHQQQQQVTLPNICKIGHLRRALKFVEQRMLAHQIISNRYHKPIEQNHQQQQQVTLPNICKIVHLRRALEFLERIITH
jgi:hypothetical protein